MPGYAFNKAHSVSYAYIAYQTAYFKANYPREYMASLLNAHLGSQDRAGSDAEECRAPGTYGCSTERERKHGMSFPSKDVRDPNDEPPADRML